MSGLENIPFINPSFQGVGIGIQASYQNLNANPVNYAVYNETRGCMWNKRYNTVAEAKKAVEEAGDPRHSYSIYTITLATASMTPTKFMWT